MRVAEEQMLLPQTAHACTITAVPWVPTVGLSADGRQVLPLESGDYWKCLPDCLKHNNLKEFLSCMAKCMGKAWLKANCGWLVCRVAPTFCVGGVDPCIRRDRDIHACQSCCEAEYYCCLVTERFLINWFKCYAKAVECHARCLCVEE